MRFLTFILLLLSTAGQATITYKPDGSVATFSAYTPPVALTATAEGWLAANGGLNVYTVNSAFSNSLACLNSSVSSWDIVYYNTTKYDYVDVVFNHVSITAAFERFDIVWRASSFNVGNFGIPNDGYQVQVIPSSCPSCVTLFKDGFVTLLATSAVGPVNSTDFKVEIIQDYAGNITVLIDNSAVISVVDNSYTGKQFVGFGVFNSPNMRVSGITINNGIVQQVVPVPVGQIRRVNF